jgi:tRNA(Ile)-lysidine synthase
MTAKSRRVGPALRSRSSQTEKTRQFQRFTQARRAAENRPGLRDPISKSREKAQAGAQAGSESRPHLQPTANPRVNWPAVAAALAAAIPRERLDPAVLRWTAERSSREGWAVAFSGGPDSLALLLLLWAHWPERRRALRALHFDHRLRGAESRADVAFCRRVCAALEVKFVSGHWRRAKKALPVSEAEARAARHAFFAEHSRSVWLGHQQDDIAETLFMRLARGSGTGGLAAPRPVQPMPGGRMHVRPLLSLKKAEIVAALRRAHIPWREDSTNAGRDFLRNRVRRDVLPAWVEAAQRDAMAGAARSRVLLEEDDAALEAILDDLLPAFRRGASLDLTLLAGKPRALWRRALHRWLAAQPRAGELSRQAFEALLDAITQGQRTRHSVGREGFAVTNGRLLWFEMIGKRARIFRRPAN